MVYSVVCFCLVHETLTQTRVRSPVPCVQLGSSACLRHQELSRSVQRRLKELMSSREAMVALDQQLKAMVKELDIKIEESADIFVYRVCFGIEEIGVMCFISVWLVLGIGSMINNTRPRVFRSTRIIDLICNAGALSE